MNYVNRYFEFMKEATSATQSVDAVKKRLDENGFMALDMDSLWTLNPGGKYYIAPYSSMITAFTLGSDQMIQKGFKVITAHTDNPAFRIKPNPEVVQDGMVTLNVERYGGPIFNSWFDRPLSIAGKVALKSNEVLKPLVKHVDLKRAILTIPNLAIHMNREVNKGVEIKIQKEMQPLLTNLIEDELKDNMLISLVAKELEVEVSDILDFDLYLYCVEEGMLLGAKEEYMSCPRIDDLSMVYAGLEALLGSEHKEGVNMCVFFDNEEIGSTTKQGADSMILTTIMNRIRMGMNRTEEQFTRQLMDSFVISADGAHALHPNYPEKNDITSKPVMNKGIAIKISGNKSYASEVESIGAFQQLCEKAGVSYQKFVNHSDAVGGKTLGPLFSKYIPIPVVDVGVPMLAMHSTRELMGKQDYLDFIAVFNTFFSLDA